MLGALRQVIEKAISPAFGNWEQRAVRAARRAVVWGRRRLPAGLRTVVGVAFIAGGLLGFLPALGFWMIPIGFVLVALDVPPLQRRLSRWLVRRKRRNVSK
jgi:hypothetical protein